MLTVGAVTRIFVATVPVNLRATEPLSKEQVPLSLFPSAPEPPATAEVAVPQEDAAPEPKPRQRQMHAPAARQLEAVIQRLEPAEKVCPHSGQVQ